jgi:hypothetical protein
LSLSALRTRTWLLAERRLQIAKYKTSFGSIDGGPTHADAPGNLLVAGPRVSGQQNLHPLEPARRVRATAQNRCQLGALGLAEFDPIAYIHPCLRLSRHRRTTESDGWRESLYKTFTPKQGQYLAFIHLYTRLHRRPPAETNMQEYFRVSPPSVHQMVLTPERPG